MRISRSRLPLCLALVASLAAGCGATAPTDRGALAPRAQGPSARLAPGSGIAVTTGRLGDATRQTSAGPLEHLAHGGRLDPRATAPSSRRSGLGAGAACADADLMPDAGNVAAIAAAALCLVNGERSDRGLVALRPNELLARAALRHARDMVDNQYFAHDGRDGSTMTDRITATGYLHRRGAWAIGENLAWGTASLATPRAIVNAWMNSPGHRANILEPRYRDAGMSVVPGNPTDRSGDGATFANEFGEMDGAATLASDRTRLSVVARRGAHRRQAVRRRAARHARSAGAKHRRGRVPIRRARHRRHRRAY